MSFIIRRRKLGRTSANKIAEYSNHGIIPIRNWKAREMQNLEVHRRGHYLFRWGCTSEVPESFTVVNSAASIAEVANKKEFRRVLNQKGYCPRTWFNAEEALANNPIYPVIVRRATHAQGRYLHVCNNIDELLQIAQLYRRDGYYISEFIDKVSEYRIFVVQGRVVWVVRKTPGNPGDVAWNVARGGRFDNVKWEDWPLKACKLAIAAMDCSSLDFGGVDVMIDRDNNCTVLEINSAPSQTSPYRQSCTAKAFDWIVLNGKDKIPTITAKGGWRKFIHPAISDEAIILDNGGTHGL